MTCQQARIALGAYVLGALEPGERSAVDGHLAGCAACRDELAALAGLPGLLGRLREDDVLTDPSPPPSRLLDALLTTVGRRRRRARWLAAAAATVALATTGTAVTELVAAHPSTASRPGNSRPVVATQGQVRASATLQSRAWGTAVSLQLTGVPGGEHCTLIAVARDGRSEIAANWEATYTGRATVTGATAISRAQLVTLRVVGPDGRPLVAVGVPPA